MSSSFATASIFPTSNVMDFGRRTIKPSFQGGLIEAKDMKPVGNIDRRTYVQQRIAQLIKIQMEEPNMVQKQNINAVITEYQAGRFPTQKRNEIWAVNGTLFLTPPPLVTTTQQDVVFSESAPYFCTVPGETGLEEIACFPSHRGRTTEIDVRHRRIEYLQELLYNPTASHQHENIEAVLAEYRSGRWTGEPEINEHGETKHAEFWLVDGKVVADIKKENLLPTSRLWHEEVGYAHHQLAITGSYPLTTFMPGNCFHDISARIRCFPNRFHWPYNEGGKPTEVVVQFLNDTGSSMLTIFEDEIWHLSIDGLGDYPGRCGFTMLATANGAISREQCKVEMQLLDIATGTPLTNWFVEDAVIQPRPPQTGEPESRLSGAKMRQHMYFATPPRNLHLYVSNNKTGLMQTIPAVTYTI